MVKLLTPEGIYRWHGHKEGSFRMTAPLPLTANDELELPHGFATTCVPSDMLPKDDVEFQGFRGTRCIVTMKWLTGRSRTLVLGGPELKPFLVNEGFEPGEQLQITYGGNGYFKTKRYESEGSLREYRRLRRLLARSRPLPGRQTVEVDRITPPPSPPQNQEMPEVVDISSDDSPPPSLHLGSDDDDPIIVEPEDNLCIIKLTRSMVMVSRSLMYVPKGWILGLPSKNKKINFTADREHWVEVNFVCNKKNRCFSSGWGEFVQAAGLEAGDWVWFREIDGGILVTKGR